MAYVIAGLIFSFITAFLIGFPFLLWWACNYDNEDEEGRDVDN